MIHSRVLMGGVAFVIVITCGAYARDAGSNAQFPYSIMAPEPGTSPHHRGAASRRANVRPHVPSEVATRPTVRRRYATRGSSSSVLPTPLPRTRLIPPEGGGISAARPTPQQQGLTFVPSAPSLGGVPNLPHGPESFQDRASRCSLQQSLYGVPGNLSNQYMGACVQ